MAGKSVFGRYRTERRRWAGYSGARPEFVSYAIPAVAPQHWGGNSRASTQKKRSGSICITNRRPAGHWRPNLPGRRAPLARDRPPWARLRAIPSPSVNRSYLRQLTPAALTAATSVPTFICIGLPSNGAYNDTACDARHAAQPGPVFGRARPYTQCDRGHPRSADPGAVAMGGRGRHRRTLDAAGRDFVRGRVFADVSRPGAADHAHRPRDTQHRAQLGDAVGIAVPVWRMQAAICGISMRSYC